MNRLALGTVQFGLDYGISNQRGQVSLDEARAIISHARFNGVDTLDTAIAYGNSEQRLAQIGIEDWRVITKVPGIPDGCSAVDRWVGESVRCSLERLKVKRLYGLLLHQPQQLTGEHGDQIYRALRLLKDERLVEKIGISIYNPLELDTLCGRYQFDLLQAPFNLMDQRLISTGWLARLSAMNIELHVRSVFLQGLLLMSGNSRPRKFDRWSSNWSKYEAWLRQTGLTPLQACLRHAISFDGITRIVVGVDSLDQLKEIFQAAVGPFPDVPQEIQCFDPNLINPSHWATL